MLQFVTKCNINYPHLALLAHPVKCILFAGAVLGSRPWRAAEYPRPGGLGAGLEAPNEPARRAPYEGVAAFFRLRNPRKMTGRQPGHGCGGLGPSPMKPSAKRALLVREAEARAAGQWRPGEGWQPLAPGRGRRAAWRGLAVAEGWPGCAAAVRWAGVRVEAVVSGLTPTNGSGSALRN